MSVVAIPDINDPDGSCDLLGSHVPPEARHVLVAHVVGVRVEVLHTAPILHKTNTSKARAANLKKRNADGQGITGGRIRHIEEADEFAFAH